MLAAARTSRKSGPGLIDEIFCKNLIIDFCRNCLPHPLHVVSVCCMVCTWSMNNGNNLTSLEFRLTCFLRLVKSCRTEQVGNTSAIPTYRHHCHRCHRPSFVDLTYERLGTLLQEVGVKKQLVLGVQSRCIRNRLDARICTCQENKNSNFKIVLTTNDFFVLFYPP